MTMNYVACPTPFSAQMLYKRCHVFGEQLLEGQNEQKRKWEKHCPMGEVFNCPFPDELERECLTITEEDWKKLFISDSD